MRISEEKQEVKSLDKSECGLLELKLQKLEQENKDLLQSFELERQIFGHELDNLKQDLTNSELNNFEETMNIQPEKTSVEKLKDKLHYIRQISEGKERDNVFLSQENLALQQEKSKLSDKLRILEEKLENIQMEGTESKLLELKVKKLEEENKGLLDEFEMERKMFNDLFEKPSRNRKLISLRESLEAEKKGNVRLLEEKLNLERAVSKLAEKVRIAEEREEAISLESSECSLLEIKLQKQEEENRNMLKTFESEREIFNKTYEHNAKNEVKLNQLIEENLQVKDVIKKGRAKVEELSVLLKNKVEEHQKIYAENAQNIKRIDDLDKKIKIQGDELKTLENSSKEKEAENESIVRKLNTLSIENEKLKKELDQKDEQVSELSKNITNLSEVIQRQTVEFNSLLERTQQLDSVLEKMQIDGAEAVKREKERQNELTSKIEELQKELDGKTNKLANLSEKVTELEKLYAEEQNNYKAKIQEIESLQRKVAELQALEESYKMIGQEKQVVDNELDKLKQVESEFKAKNNDALKKYKLIEQQCNIIKVEKENLLDEVNHLRSKIEDLSAENNNLQAMSSKIAESEYNLGQLKNENNILQNKCDSLNEEMLELNLRINQISSDNRIIVEENQNLIRANEELKIKIEFLEKEEGEFAEIKNKLVEENMSLTNSITEIKQQLADIQKQNLQLVNDRNIFSSNEVDINKIQRDFYEIKEKCDSLFVENKNLKSEYKKLEDKCNDFGKLLQDEVQELKISPVNIKSKSKLDQLEILKREKAFTTDASTSSGTSSQSDKDEYAKEIEILQGILTQYKSLDITNKSSIEFYENELQKMKNQNEKLNRKLDETLVTLNHCAELSNSTEVEYLKNVLYNYMLGKESMVLARVIAAVCKFDPQQTETVLQREQQKQTL
ncbi:hypothetical protein NQ314_000333, partial [Rhamnusium bicolor]